MTAKNKSTQKIVNINEKSYLINAFKGYTGWSFLPRLTKYVFPFIGFLFNEDKKDEELVGKISELLSGDNAKEVVQLIIDIVESVQVENSKVDFNEEFSQNYDALILLVVEVIKLNYLESFQRLATNLPSQV